MSETLDEANEARQRIDELVSRARGLEVRDYALAGVVVLLLIIGVFVSDRFLTLSNMETVLKQASVVGVISMGMTFVIVTAGIDLSVGAMLAAASVAGGTLAEALSGIDGLAFIVGAIAFGILLGAVNATAITFGRVVPFIATLAMFLAARGIALWMSDQQPISVARMDAVRWFGNGDLLGIPVPILVFLLVTIAAWVLLNRTAYGRYVVAVGGNREAARISGIRVNRIVFSVYVLSGLCTGIAAVLLSGRLASASPVAGNLLELDAIAAVVIGGTSLAGGKGTIVGTTLGVLTFALIFNLLNLLNLPVEIQQIVKGAIIVAAVVLQRRDD
ncbi:MAG: ABC transporter permease [Nitriliruptorales bacterium]|nr:ABC transporter permease [Nitriliruptorales bacterium]